MKFNISKMFKGSAAGCKIGGEDTLTIVYKTRKRWIFEWDDMRCSIHYKRPSDSLIREFEFASIEDNIQKYTSPKTGNEKEKLWEITWEMLYKPFAQKIITGFEGYYNIDGKALNGAGDFDEIAKFKETHIRVFVNEIFQKKRKEYVEKKN